MSRPLVSVCVPTFEQATFLDQALESALGQTLRDLEVIVVDDASTDATPEIAARFRDPRLTVRRQRRRVGIAENRNACLRLARGRYVAWLDSDDVYEPDMLERQCAVLEAHPRVGMAHGGFRLIDASGRELRAWEPAFEADEILTSREAFADLAVVNVVVAPTVVVRRSIHDVVGPYARSIGASSTDWEMWLRIALRADVAYTAAPLARYRIHPTSVSARTARRGARLRCDRRAIRRVFALEAARIPDAGRLRRRAEAALSARAVFAVGQGLAAGRRFVALRALAEAALATPNLLARRPFWSMAHALVAGDEYHAHHAGRALLAGLASELEGTRLAGSIRKRVAVDPAWERTMRDTARIVRRIVPPRERVASVDKHDPTLLHFAGRRGHHFPDLRSMDGYPADSVAAIEHLDDLRRRGTGWIVFPRPSFWWLEFYEDFRRHLDTVHRCAWDDPTCRLYRLSTVGGVA